MKFILIGRSLFILSVLALLFGAISLVYAADHGSGLTDNNSEGTQPRVVWPLPAPEPGPIPVPANVVIPDPPLSLMTEKFSVNAGVFSGSISSGGNQNNQTPFSSEETFGINDRAILFPNLRLMFRLAERQRFEFEYFRSRRSGGLTNANTYPSYLEPDTEFYDSTVYTVSKAIESSEMEWRTIKGRFALDLLRGDRYWFAAFFGLQYDQALFALQSPILIDPMVPQSQARTFRRTVWGMTDILPTVGFELAWMIDPNKHWSILVRHEKVQSTKTTHADLQYRWHPNISLGVGYTSYKNIMKIDATSLQGMELNFSMVGPEAFLRFSY